MKKPNIVFILADDLGEWALGCSGNQDIDTPNIDKIAQNGVYLENFFCASPVCSPARASLLTGTIPSAHGVHDWIRSGNLDAEKFAAQGEENPYGRYRDESKPISYLEGMTCYTDVLAEHGYTCALSGKWHLGDSITPQHGFSHWYTLGKGGCYYYHPDIVEDGQITVEHGKYVTDLITDDALRSLEQLSAHEEPFYLSVHYTAPHSPWGPEHHPEEYLQRYQNCAFSGIPDIPDHPNTTVGAVYGTEMRGENLRGYFASITAMDAQIGRIIESLEDKGLLEDTILIFTSDNGMNMGHHGIWGKGNGTFPQNMFDTSIKVPFIISHPTKIPQGVRCEQMASGYDFFPTILELAGLSVPNHLRLPGTSFVSALGGAPQENKDIVVFDEYGPVRMIRTEEFKYVQRYPYGPNELYDLKTDPDENTNLVEHPDHAPTILSLRRKMERWFLQYTDPTMDGTKENVTGLGQLSSAGVKAEKLYKYYTD